MAKHMPVRESAFGSHYPKDRARVISKQLPWSALGNPPLQDARISAGCELNPAKNNRIVMAQFLLERPLKNSRLGAMAQF
jgi:hypothetical protein